MITFKSTTLFTSIIWVALLLFVGALYAAESYTNEPGGFRGIAWGTPLSENKDEMVHVKSNIGIDSYSRKNSKMSIGKAPLSELHYGYLQNRFLAVYIKTSNKKDHTLLRKEFDKQFGPGQLIKGEKGGVIRKGETGTVIIAVQGGASINSTQLLRLQFKLISAQFEQFREEFEQQFAEINKLAKQFMKEYSEMKSGSDF